jgi:hypothetical protein
LRICCPDEASRVEVLELVRELNRFGVAANALIAFGRSVASKDGF